MRETKEYTILNSVTPQAVTSSTDATPIVVTKNSHGYSNGDLVIIYGHATNVAANGIYRVANKAANTFELTDRYSGANIAGSGAGAGSGGVMCACPSILFVEDFRHLVLEANTAGTATLTFKVAGSLGKLSADTSNGHGDTPNFGATQDDANGFYNFINLIDLLDGSSISGSTGIAVAGTDINKTYELNVNGLKYVTVIPTAFTQGAITIKAKLFNQ